MAEITNVRSAAVNGYSGGFCGTVVVAAQLRQQFQELRENGGLFWQRLFGDDAPHRLPFAGVKHGGTGKCRAGPVEVGQVQHAPGDDLVKRQTVLQSMVRFELNLFDATARLENPEIDFHRPARRVMVDHAQDLIDGVDRQAGEYTSRGEE